MKRIVPATLALVAATFAIPPAQAQTFSDPAAIDAAIAAFTGVPIGQPGGAAQPVDRRLRLAPCRQALAIAWHGPAASARRDTLAVRCPDAGGWRLFVPVVQGANGAMASASPAVTRGEAVTITVTGPGFAVSQAAEAMESGPVGAWIKVRTASRNEPLRAQVVRPGLVSVPVP